jgi:hypothetical protein
VAIIHKKVSKEVVMPSNAIERIYIFYVTRVLVNEGVPRGIS